MQIKWRRDGTDRQIGVIIGRIKAPVAQGPERKTLNFCQRGFESRQAHQNSQKTDPSKGRFFAFYSTVLIAPYNGPTQLIFNADKDAPIPDNTRGNIATASPG
jgi:hypothetical protein